MTFSCDYLIVGAGIVGLAVARELKRRYPPSRAVVLEKESDAGRHTSARNSGVLYSGVSTVRRLVAELTPDDLQLCDKVGIEPQLINIEKKTLDMGYIIEQFVDSLRVLNVISPAFTTSLAFAEWIVHRAEGRVH